MKGNYSRVIRYLDLTTVLMLALVLLLREMGIDGSNGGIDFANIAGRIFMILFIITTGIHLLDPNVSVVDKIHRGLFGEFFRRK